MAIFKYELRQLRVQIIWWSIAAAFLIFSMLPTYIGFVTSGALNFSVDSNNSIFDMLGMDIYVIATPVGTFGFLTAFFSIAAGIYGMALGLKTFTKETVQKSAEFIYTKPYKRGKVFCAKVLAAFCAASITGVCYYIGSVISAFANISEGFDFRALSLIAVSFTLIEFFFVFFGAFVGAVYSKIRTPMLTSAGIAFMFFVLSSFAGKVGANALKYLTPYSYFSASGIVKNGGYAAEYVAAFIVLCIIFSVGGYYTFVKKDVSFIS